MAKLSTMPAASNYQFSQPNQCHLKQLTNHSGPYVGPHRTFIMKLESLIVTAQQEHGLAAFRAQQDEQDSLKDKDFFGWYTMWTYENGFFNDTNELPDEFPVSF